MSQIIYPEGTSASDFVGCQIPNYRDTTRYRTSHTYNEVAAFLRRTKDCVKAGRFVVLTSDGREHNEQFLNAYGLYSPREQSKLLLSLEVEEFCHSVLASDGRELLVFCPRRVLYKSNVGLVPVCVYVKHDCPPDASPYDCVISMHELRYPIELLFA